MTDIRNNLITNLRRLGLSDGEAKVYLALLGESMTHLELARKTKINRTKVYRLVDDLKQRGLVNSEQRDDGKVLTAASPDNLEVSLVNRENHLKAQRQILDATLPVLESVFEGDMLRKDFFSVSTYQGTAGLKQMLWNELKTKGEICIFAHDTLDTLAGRTWAEKYRARLAAAKIPHRALENSESNHVLDFTKAEGYPEVYNVRMLPREVFHIQQELTIHDDTVSIYNWRGTEDALRVGVEIKNADFAKFMIDIFEDYWKRGSS